MDLVSLGVSWSERFEHSVSKTPLGRQRNTTFETEEGV